GKYIGKYIGEYYEILIKKVISNNITDIFDKSSTLINNIKEKVLKNKECTKEIFEKLSDDNFWGTRGSVAENLNCPSHVLEKLSNDKDGLVVLEVAENMSCPIKLLENLIANKYGDGESCKYWEDKIKIAAKNTLIKILERDSNSEDYCI